MNIIRIEIEKRLHRVKILSGKNNITCPQSKTCDIAENCLRCNNYFEKCMKYNNSI
jgi:hypothetical protein